MNKTELKNASIDSIESMADFYEKTADEIWENPELSLKEYKAAERGVYAAELFAHIEAVLAQDAAVKRRGLILL